MFPSHIPCLFAVSVPDFAIRVSPDYPALPFATTTYLLNILPASRRVQDASNDTIWLKATLYAAKATAARLRTTLCKTNQVLPEQPLVRVAGLRSKRGSPSWPRGLSRSSWLYYAYCPSVSWACWPYESMETTMLLVRLVTVQVGMQTPSRTTPISMASHSHTIPHVSSSRPIAIA